jgi:hypothetical protein
MSQLRDRYSQSRHFLYLFSCVSVTILFSYNELRDYSCCPPAARYMLTSSLYQLVILSLLLPGLNIHHNRAVYVHIYGVLMYCCSMPPKRAASKGVKEATKRLKSSSYTTPPPPPTVGQLSMEAEERIMARIVSQVATVVQDTMRSTVAHPGVAAVQVATVSGANPTPPPPITGESTISQHIDNIANPSPVPFAPHTIHRLRLPTRSTSQSLRDSPNRSL